MTNSSRIILLISDSTGETAQAAARAALTQFADADAKLEVVPFLRSLPDLDALPQQRLETAALLVLTVSDPVVREALERRAAAAGVPAISLLDPLVKSLARVLDQRPGARPGRQYRVDAAYMDRVSAIDYAVAHDDGATRDYLMRADVILVGVSRTSKTPTCIYLACQGVKAANVPIVPGVSTPDALHDAITAGIPAIGLTASAERLAQLRATRLTALGSPSGAGYTDRARIEEELVAARLFFDRHQLPAIDVTRRAIEETAATIRHYLDMPR